MYCDPNRPLSARMAAFLYTKAASDSETAGLDLKKKYEIQRISLQS